MWKTLIVGTTLLTIAGSTLASAQQPSPTERSHRAQLAADDIAAFTDARIAALKTALKLTPDQEKNWPAVEQALRDISKERLALRQARSAAGQPVDATERLRDRADALAARATALRRRRREAAVPESRRGAEAPFRHRHALRRASAHGASPARLSASARSAQSCYPAPRIARGRALRDVARLHSESHDSITCTFRTIPCSDRVTLVCDEAAKLKEAEAVVT
jgi:hypothetical protein